MSLPMKWWTSVCRAPPPIVEPLAVRVAPLPRRGQVADGGVEPDVPVIARAVGNLEAEIGRRPRHVPIVQRLAEEMALQVVGHFGLQRARSRRPTASRKPCSCSMLTNKWLAVRISGLAPESVLTGSIRSVGL